MPSFRYDGKRISERGLAEVTKKFAPKLLWFMQHGYIPHYWQLLFHTMQYEDKLCRYRHLVAGRRGGKTLSAAWELLYYALNPEQFHEDSHSRPSKRNFWSWVLTKDFPAGRPALLTFREILAESGLVHGKDYKENRGNRYFEFENGSLIEFKTADEPESLRGAGLDLLWMDEAAFIPNNDAYNVVRPALSDRQGLVISTTTPSGKNWFYDEFWGEEALKDERIGRVEYRSLDNPYFPREEWFEEKKRYHPMLFRQEYMASFDAMQGRELLGDWLHYYKSRPKSSELTCFMGIDPAISLSDKADSFAMALIGVTKDHNTVYLLDTYKGRIPFPEQVDIISQWYFNKKYKPIMIGVEAQAYQQALVQQLQRIPNLPPIIPMFAKGRKETRILSMSPLFKYGKVKIREEQQDFINEWLDYDSTLKNPKDDLLDAVEIALRTAGAIIPDVPNTITNDPNDFPASDMDELALRNIPGGKFLQEFGGADEYLGEDW